MRTQRTEARAAKELKKGEKEERDQKKKEAYTRELETVGGLWIGNISTRVESLTSGKAKRTALEAQLRFRRFVLGNRNVDNVLSLSSGGKKLDVPTLIDNLQKVVDGQSAVPAADTPTEVSVTILSCDVLQAAKEKFRGLIEKQEARGRVASGSTRRRDRQPQVQTGTSSVEEPEDLVGKRIEHLFQVGRGKKWYKGTVVGVKVGDSDGDDAYFFNIKYDGEKRVCEYDLLTDFENGELRIIPLDANWLVGHRIEHQFKSEDDGQLYWYTGQVISFDESSQQHTIQYDWDDDDDDDDDTNFTDNISVEPVLKDYLNGDVRVLV